MSDEIIQKIYEKVEKIADDVSELKITSIKHDINLETHMEASRTLKAMYEDMKEKDIEPLKSDMNQIKGMTKFILAIGTVGGFFLGIFKFFIKH